MEPQKNPVQYSKSAAVYLYYSSQEAALKNYNNLPIISK